MGRPSVRQWLVLAFALVALNATLTFANVWPTLAVVPRAEISIELAVLLLVLVAWTAFVAPVGRVAWAIVTMLAVLYFVGRYAEVTSPALYGRPVNVYWDAQHIPNVAAMLVEVAPWWAVVLLVGVVVGFFAAVTAALRWCLLRVAAALAIAPMRRALGAGAAAAVVAYAAGNAFDWPVRHYFAVPVSATYLQQIEFLADAYTADERRELAAVPLAPSDLGRAAGADVVAMFLESYGAVTYEMPEVERRVAPARREFAAAATATGRNVVSAFVTSPTFGGGSWLAHSTFMSGIEVRDPDTYALLLTQRRATVPKLFKERGFRSIALMPGMRNDWPEGAYYGFDVIYDERSLVYNGPDFGWWRIPDQYSLAMLDLLEPRAGRAPLFVFFPTINTHIPFVPIPPYQPDWARLRTAEPFEPASVAASVGREADWLALGAPYGESFAYTFEYLAGYLRERAAADTVFVFIGDHQPAASVTGVDARWDVPVHVVTRRDDIAAAFVAAGFTEGVDLEPHRPAVATMAELTTLLLRALDSAGGAPVH
jgi:hypothetical protein